MVIYNFFSFLSRRLSAMFSRKFSVLVFPKKRAIAKTKVLGFTLIEVLVVVVVVGVLSAIVAPSWQSFTTNQRLGASQSKIFQAIKSAQSDAKNRQKENNTNRTTITLTTELEPIDSTNNKFPNRFKLDNVNTNGGLSQSLEQGVVIKKITKGGSTTPTVITPTDLGSTYTIEFDSKGFLYATTSGLDVPICINLETSLGQKKKWIKIQTLLGAITTGADSTCSG